MSDIATFPIDISQSFKHRSKQKMTVQGRKALAPCHVAPPQRKSQLAGKHFSMQYELDALERYG